MSIESGSSIPSAEVPSSATEGKKEKGNDKKSKATSLGSLAFQPNQPKAGEAKPQPFSFFRKERDQQETEKPADKKEPSKLVAEATDLSAEEVEALPIDALGPKEEVEVTKQLAQGLAAEMPVATNQEEIEQVADHADSVYLARVQETGDADASLEEAAAVLGIELGQEDTPEPTSSEVLIDPSVESEGEVSLHDDPEDTPITPPVPTAPVTGPAAPKGRGRAGGPPPSPPLPPSPGGPIAPVGPPPGGGGMPPFGGPGRPFGPPTPGGPPLGGGNIAPVAPAVMPVAEALARQRRAQNEGLLLGGIVGYLFGRRRGRIKAEKRLMPVQRKLEKQVKELHNKLVDNEMIIRKAAAKKHIESQPALAAAPTRIESRPARSEKSPAITVPPERIGKVIVAAEALPSRRSAVSGAEAVVPKVDKVSAERQAFTLSRTELLAVSETVAVEGTSLRKIYETNLISEKGLRRLVAEHLRGGNVQRALKRELVEREIDFERDPILRDKAGRSSNGGGGGSSPVDGFLKHTGALAMGDKNPPSSKPAKASKAAAQPAENSAKKPATSALADVGLVVVICVLLLLIVAVLARR